MICSSESSRERVEASHVIVNNNLEWLIIFLRAQVLVIRICLYFRTLLCLTIRSQSISLIYFRLLIINTKHVGSLNRRPLSSPLSSSIPKKVL